MAATFDPGLMERVTTVIREQMRAVGAHLGLSPVLDLARDFRWGRVEETFGEDPYLVGAMAAAYVRGLHGPNLAEGIAATLKHFAGHGVCEEGATTPRCTCLNLKCGSSTCCPLRRW